MRGLLPLLRRPRFAVVTMGEGLSMLGDAAFEVGLAWAHSDHRVSHRASWSPFPDRPYASGI